MKTLVLLSLAAASLNAISYNDLSFEVRLVNPDAPIKMYDRAFDDMDSRSLMFARVAFQKLVNKSKIVRVREFPAKFDCDDFARVFQSVVALQSLKDNMNYACGTLVVKHKHAFGGIPTRGNAIHMLNIVYLNGELVVIEPQTLKSVPLSEYPNKDYIIEITF